MGLIGNFEKGKNVHKTIEDMLVGEKAYIVPWVIAVDENLNAYLYLRAVVLKEPAGEAYISIIRTGQGDKDYDVDIRNVSYKWETVVSPLQGWNGFDPARIVMLDAGGVWHDAEDVEKQKLICRWEKQLRYALEKEDYRSAGYLRDKIKELKPKDKRK